MSCPDKKISFSFCKVKKPNAIQKKVVEPKEKIEYVDSFNGVDKTFSYKGNIRKDETIKQELIIPLITSENHYFNKNNKNKSELKTINGSHGSHITSKINSNTDQKSKNTDEKFEEYLEKRAEAEILDGIKNKCENAEIMSNSLVIEPKSLQPEPENNSVIDYENIPVSDFGLAMLRGMGWKPNYGMGKNPRLIKTVSPKLRPKGLGLGAKFNTDKVDKKES